LPLEVVKAKLATFLSLLTLAAHDAARGPDSSPAWSGLVITSLLSWPPKRNEARRRIEGHNVNPAGRRTKLLQQV
jgi:hypothetical protein